MSEQSVQDVRMVATALSECQEAKGTGIDLLRRGFTSKSLKSHQRQLVDTSSPACGFSSNQVPAREFSSKS